MTPRKRTWLIGALGTAALLAASRPDRTSWTSAVLLALLAMVATALLAEAVSIGSAAGLRRRPGPPPGALPADGVVDVVPMIGVEGAANPKAPGFRRFRSTVGPPGEPARVLRLPGGRPTLLGRVALISLFVGRDGKAWTVDEIARGIAALERAGAWIEREAARRSARINLCLADTYFSTFDDEVDDVEVAFAAEGGDVGPMEAHASTKAIVAASRAAASLGFSDAVDLMGRINPRVDADARVWLVHVRRSGRSLAIPAWESEVDGVGLAVCYAREASFPEPLAGTARVDPVTVAHELLHLFGATDKYGLDFGSFPPRSVTSRDIMRLDHENLSRLTIDGLTGLEIGWDPVPPGPARKNARR